MLMGPKRDIIGELAAATRKANLIFGLSSHRIEHWWFFGGGRTFDSDVNDSAYEDFYGPAKLKILLILPPNTCNDAGVYERLAFAQH